MLLHLHTYLNAFHLHTHTHICVTYICKYVSVALECICSPELCCGLGLAKLITPRARQRSQLSHIQWLYAFGFELYNL